MYFCCRNIFVSNISKQQQTVKNYIKNGLRFKTVANTRKCMYTLPKITTITGTITSGLLLKLYVNSKVLCDGEKTRLVGLSRNDGKDLKFDWSMFWFYLKPHIWYFIAAIVVC